MKMERMRRACAPAAAALFLFLVAGWAPAAELPKAPPPARKEGAPVHPQYAVPTPPFTPGIFPCSDCHKEMKPNPKRRELKDEHTNIVLNHAQGERWCLDCHDTYDRDRLHLVNGQRIRFEESYRLCGQCHGDKYRDWKVGVHGKRTGMWNGEKQYLLCVNCHNPHDPRFKPLAPMPPPVRPEAIRK
jgi:Doubled CXXCH motif (Paired_CXXCH_1)